LRFGSQGQYRSAFSHLFGTRLRYPWDPQAVSDPWLVQEEFPGLRPPTAADRAQAQAAHEAPAKITRTVPLEFKDNGTGEHFDVVQDDNLSPDPGEELGDEDDRARGVDEGGARGATVRSAQAVPRAIMDEAIGEVLDVIQDNEPDLPPVSNLQEPEDLTQRRVRRAP
jgi:hypothetical protein